MNTSLKQDFLLLFIFYSYLLLLNFDIAVFKHNFNFCAAADFTGNNLFAENVFNGMYNKAFQRARAKGRVKACIDSWEKLVLPGLTLDGMTHEVSCNGNYLR